MVNETLETGISFVSILPYIVSVVCATIAGFSSYAVARKQARADIKKLEKQHELDIEKERERFVMEKEKLEITHQYQMELLRQESENAMGTSMTSALLAELMKMPEFKEQISQGMRNKRGRKG